MSEPVVDPNQQRYHFFLVSDGGGPPVSLFSDDLPKLSQQAYQEIIKAGSGWCHFIVDGQRCYISNPAQLFQLRLPSGALAPFGDTSSPVFDANGKFSTLRPRSDDYFDSFFNKT